jgi:hypothetical protein
MEVDKAELRERNKKNAATHEAGHVVVAAVHGVHVKASIWEDGDAICGRAHTILHECPALIRLAVGFAGAVAECFEDECFDAEMICEEIAGGRLAPSDTDWASAGIAPEHGPPEDAINLALNTLRENRELFDWCVAELVEHGDISHVDVILATKRLTDSKAWDWFPDLSEESQITNPKG